jgi:hypothetical protein
MHGEAIPIVAFAIWHVRTTDQRVSLTSKLRAFVGCICANRRRTIEIARNDPRLTARAPSRPLGFLITNLTRPWRVNELAFRPTSGSSRIK